MTTRQYVNETRTVQTRAFSSTDQRGELTGEFVVNAYSILSTDHVVFDAYEAFEWNDGDASHSCTQSFDDLGVTLGAVRSRALPAVIAAMPYGPNRTKAVQIYQRNRDVLAEELVRTAFPELFAHYGPGRTGDGHGSCTLDDWHTTVQA